MPSFLIFPLSHNTGASAVPVRPRRQHPGYKSAALTAGLPPTPISFTSRLGSPILRSPSNPPPSFTMLDLNDPGVTFFDDRADRYWHPEVIQNPPPPVTNPLDRSNWQDVIVLLRLFAPHLRRTFVCDPNWWERHWGTPEAHVSQARHPYLPTICSPTRRCSNTS